MTKTALRCIIYVVMFVASALLVVGSTAAQSFPTPVTTITKLPPPAADAFATSVRFGPDGLIYAWDGMSVWRQSGVNVDSFGSMPIGTVPSIGADAGPINFSQDGKTILIGNGAGGQDFSGNSNGLLYTMPASGGAATMVGTVTYHQDFIPVPAASTIPASNTKFIVDLGHSDFATSEVDLFDFTTGKVTPIIQNIPGASSSIALDSANRLYVGIGFGSRQGEIQRFTLPLVDLAAGGKPLDWTSGQLFNSADNNSGAGMFFDARGNLFAGGPNGVAIFDKSGASQVYSTGTSSFPVITRNATNDQFSLTLGGSDPMMLGYSPLIYKASDLDVPAPPTSNWNVDDDGNWSDGSHWDNGAAPNGIDQRAVLGSAISAPRTVTLDLPVTLGTLTINSSRKYVIGGPSALTMQVSSTIAAIDVTGGSHEIAAPLVLASDTDVTVQNSADSLTISGPVSGSGTLSKEGGGSLTIAGPNTYAGNTAVDGGRLRFNIASGTATVSAGATATIAPGATLELAGDVSALGTAGGNRAHVVNDSAVGLIVSGTNQLVGGIDGGGVTTVSAGGDLTADYLNQSVLVIGGSATSFARVTIAPSDASGNPLDASASTMILADSLTSTASFAEGIDSAVTITEFGALRPVTAVSSTNVSGAGTNRVTVPEPSSCALLFFAIVTLLASAKRRDRTFRP